MRFSFLFFILGAFCSIYGQDTLTLSKSLENELLIQPTPYTFPAGTVYLESYELMFLNAGVSVTDNTHLSAGILFPVVKGFEQTFSFGIKQRLYKDDINAMAVTGVYNPHTEGYVAAGLYSFKFKKSTTNFLLGVGSYDNHSLILAGAGILSKIKPNRAAIAEYSYLYQDGVSSDKRSSHIASFGVRFIGEEISWELAIGLSLGGNFDGIIPLIKAGVLL